MLRSGGQCECRNLLDYEAWVRVAGYRSRFLRGLNRGQLTRFVHYLYQDVNMTDASPPAVVINCAAASDGGSLWLQLSVGGQARGYSLYRSLAARGTPRYDEISGEDGLLKKDQLQGLLSTLEDVREYGTCAGVIDEFVKVLKKSALA